MSEDRQNGGENFGEVHRKSGYGTPAQIANLRPPWSSGVSGNPEGRKTMGAYLREELNSLATDEGLSEDKLRRIAKDKEAHPRKRAAAVRALRMIELPDMADFAGLVRGENNLEELRAMGVNTELIKKFEQTTRASPTGKGDGEVEEIIQRKIELYDRSGEDFDRCTNQTAGNPTQPIEADVRNTGDDRANVALQAIATMMKAEKDAPKPV